MAERGHVTTDDPVELAQRVAELEDRLRRFIGMQDLLFEVSRAIGPAVELQPTLESVIRAMRELVDFKGGTICLVEQGLIRIAASDPAVSQDVMDARLPVGEGLAGRVVASGQPIYSPCLQEDARVDQELAGTGTNATIVSYIGVPLIVLGQVTGLLQIDSSERDAFTDDDLYVLQGLAAQVAGAIESARRYEAVVELERLKSDFIERVSHELRTPLTVLGGFTETLLDEERPLPADEARGFLERVRHATNRLRYLIEEILMMASLQAGLSTPSMVEVNVEQALLDAASASRNPKACTVRVPEPTAVRCDPLLLERILKLLLDNALLYAGDAVLTAGREGREVHISVRDHGPGVADDVRETMFERFTRGRHTQAGMGLGLPTARELAALVHGRIEYEDRDPGSEFRIVFGANGESRQSP